MMSPTPRYPNHSETTKPIFNLKDELRKVSSEQHQPSIHRVYNGLRKIKEEAYEPAIVAIGPYHCHNHNLQKMNVTKLRYLQSLLLRHNKWIESCVSFMGRLEPKARKCYAEPTITLDPTEFTNMLVLDGCFIIEFFSRISNKSFRDEHDHIFGMDWSLNDVFLDLLLFENQLPFFVLFELCHFLDASDTTFNSLVDNVFFSYDKQPFALKRVQDLTTIKHLLELIHKSLVLPSQDYPNKDERLDFIGTASSLAKYNVKFQKTDGSCSNFQMDFGGGSMQIPCLHVKDRTESYIRNLIAYEQYFLNQNDWIPVCDYVVLMDCLINTPEDVKLLQDCGIIENWLGSEADVAKMFNKLGDRVVTSQKNFTYKEEFKRVNEHCNRRWNRWIAILNHNHFNSPWGIISLAAAVVLLILTLLQTIYTIIN